MVNRISRTNIPLKDPYLFPLETEPTEILEAMNLIVEHSENTGFTDNLLFYLQKPIHYLCERLHINEKQAVLLSVVCELGADNHVTISRLSKFFGCSNLNALTFVKELDDLANKSLIGKYSSKVYSTRWDIMDAFGNNEICHHTPVVYDTCIKMMHAIETMSYEFDGPFIHTCEEFHNELQLLLDDNQHFMFTKALKGYNLDRNDQGMLVGACILLCCHDKFCFDPDDFSRFVDRDYLSNSWDGLANGTHNLIFQELIEPSCDNGFEDDEQFELTKKAKRELLSEVISNIDGIQFKNMKDYIPFNSIMPKQLYFNDGVDKQIKRLSGLLQQENYLGIHERLVQNGLRTGFACLFYGGPGTGKTEAALQLARMTGRGIYQVNMANIRSKWVGESEKNVKNIFKQYRSIVKHSEVAPILLLNEADALLGNRFTNINHSVEKMENTMQNIILEAMEKLDGILIATTNLTENLDSAFERRFLFKVKFGNPDANARLHIWEDMIPEIKDIENHDRIVESYPFSGGQIENIARKCRIECILEGKNPDFGMLKTFCDEELLAKPRTQITGFHNKRHDDE